MNHCKTIAIVNQKGGVGKTTSTVNLGVGLAQAGNRVLLVDDDPQHSLTISLGIRNADDDLDTTLATAMQDYLPDLLNNKQDSFLEELDDGSIARWFKEAVSESVCYMVLHRCGYVPELDNDVFGRMPMIAALW